MRIATGILYAVLAVGLAVAQNPSDASNANKTEKQASTNGQDKVVTRSFKGDLVSAKCAGSGGSAETKAAPSKNSGEADRAGSAAEQGCSVSTSTSEFALKTKDGRTLPFDTVGNLRTQDALKNNKKWTSAASSGKPIQAKVNGIENDGRLTVLSVH